MGHTTIHNNNNLLCAADIYTTGQDALKDNLIGVCLLPLDSFYDVYKQSDDRKEIANGRRIVPIDIEIKPCRKNTIHLHDKLWMKSLPKGVNRAKILHAGTEGIDAFNAADYFDIWFQNLKLPYRKKITVISHNWIDKRPFLIDWLGTETYNQIFSNSYRDIVTASIFANDRADVRNNEIPYPKNFLTYLCSRMKIEYSQKQDLITNCVAIAECYRTMVKASEVPF